MNNENTIVTAPSSGQSQADDKAVTSSANLIDIINVVADRVDPLVKLITAMAERMLKSQQADARFRTHMAWVAVIIVSLIVVTAGILTYLV